MTVNSRKISKTMSAAISEARAQFFSKASCPDAVKKEKFHISFLIKPAIFIAVIIFFSVFMTTLSNDNSGRNKNVLEKALYRSITQCYALEGTYPPNLDYLVQNYGLTYNKDVYFIDYKYIGSNLRPDVTIIERNPDDRAE